jgi:hypothetical protein
MFVYSYVLFVVMWKSYCCPQLNPTKEVATVTNSATMWEFSVQLARILDIIFHSLNS